MDYRDWIKKDFHKWSQLFDFQTIPREEIGYRLKRIRDGMEKQRIEAILVVQKMDFYYITGTTQDGLLYLPIEADPLLMIKRELERARMESPLEEVVSFRSIRDVPSLIRRRRKRLPQNLGLEFDLLPAKDYFKFQEIFPGIQLLDASGVFREACKIKSPFEIDLMRKAGGIGKRVYEEAKKILKEGMTEIEFGGLLEVVAKRYGHEGLLRVRSLNYEAYTWHVLSGPTGGIVSQSDSPMGGLGLSPAFPVGASLKQIKAHEPILVDFGTCYHGYQADQTRMFSEGVLILVEI